MKKSISLSILALLCSVHFSISQNLVPNWDFEGYTNCPTSLNHLTVNEWFQPTTGTSDYFHECGSFQSQIPSLFSGYQPPKSGDGYMGIVCHTQPPIEENYREYISIALSQSLIVDQCYDFEMYVNLKNNCQYAIAEIGVHFSVAALVGGTSAPLTNTAQIVNTTGILSDTSSWTLISGSYTALGGESYITIGNFNNDTNTTFQQVYPANYFEYAYYFIEDVSLVECENVSLDKEISLSSLNPYPNPFSESISFTSPLEGQSTVIVYDITLNVISVNNFTGSLTLDTKNFESGMYFYEVSSSDEVLQTGKLLKR